MTSLVIDNIGQLVTCDPEQGDGPLGVRADVAIAFEDGLVREITSAGSASGDRNVDAGGRAVIPGFVDSHTHLVFAGDRADEFAARMAGRRYDAGGIRVTTAATRGADDDTLLALAQARQQRARRDGITHQEIKSGYGLDTPTEARCCAVANELTDDVTFLGAHVLPEEFAGRADDYVALVCGEMLRACAPHARWIDAFCEEGAFDAGQCRAVLEAGRAAGLGLRLHANQLGEGPGVKLAVELGAASADHCTYLSDADVDALAGSNTVATFLPATDFATREQYPNARRVLDAGAEVALATNTNPGSSYTTSMSSSDR
jgi:imidazolonepropionase